jgi:hypothetical protein
LRSVVRDTRVHGSTEILVSLDDDAQVIGLQYNAGRGQLSVGNRGLIADCQVNIATGPPTFLGNSTVVQAGIGAVVRDCTITAGATAGSGLGVGTNSRVSGCRINSVFRDGIVTVSANVTVEASSVQANGRNGVLLGSNARVRDCTVSGSGTEAITVGENSIVSGTIVSGSGGAGISSFAENVEVSHCTVKGVTGAPGISLQSGSVTDCTVTGTTNGPGILVAQRSIVARNRSEGNGIATTSLQPGVRVTGPNNRIENNQLVNNAGFGLEITGASAIGNLVLGNHARGNSGGASQFSIVAGNAVGAIVPLASTATDTHPSANYVP